jgi:glucose-6-phosphate isomerase
MENISFNLNNSLLDKELVFKKAEELESYTADLRKIVAKGGYEEPTSFINLPDDEHLLKKIRDFVQKEDSVKYAIVAGIGGANLGAKAVYEAIPTDKIKLLFSETLSVRQNSEIVSTVLANISSPKAVLLIGVSKSGTTTETVANLEAMGGELKNVFGKIENRTVIVTSEGSDLLKNDEVESFIIPAQIVDRFSVFSVVGLLPLALAGVDIELLMCGAKEMRNFCLSSKSSENPALLSAAAQVLYKEKDVRIHNTFLWNPELESLGKWYAQLMAESLGKKEDLEGAEVREGITPITSIGSTDLHSLLQLYFGGPNDKFTTFVRAQEGSEVLQIPKEDNIFPEASEDFSGMKMNEIMEVIYEGVKISYKKEKVPFMEIRLEELNEYTLGALLQMKMLEVIYVAKYLNINPFDQPSVTAYKEEVRKILAKK